MDDRRLFGTLKKLAPRHKAEVKMIDYGAEIKETGVVKTVLQQF